MRGRTVLAVIVAGAAVAAALVGVNLLADENGTAQLSAPSAKLTGPAPAPAGWRWEVYENVQVQVPAGWEDSKWAGPQECGPWPERKPVVRRPGGATVLMLQPCPTTPPKPLHIAPSVEFNDREKIGVTRYADGWTRETRPFSELQLTVTTNDDELRERIFGSAGVVEAIDGNGCDPAPELAVDGIQRPTAQGGLLSVGVVESVSVCQYWISGIGGSHWPLQASSLLVGTSAAELIQDVVTAPTGTGPTVTDPRVCVPDPGGELIILRAHGSEHDQDVLVRYAGCKHNGTDDGSVLRALTSNAAKRIFIGPHAPDGKSNVLYQLLIGTPPPVV